MKHKKLNITNVSFLLQAVHLKKLLQRSSIIARKQRATIIYFCLYVILMTHLKV